MPRRTSKGQPAAKEVARRTLAAADRGEPKALVALAVCFEADKKFAGSGRSKGAKASSPAKAKPKVEKKAAASRRGR